MAKGRYYKDNWRSITCELSSNFPKTTKLPQCPLVGKADWLFIKPKKEKK